MAHLPHPHRPSKTQMRIFISVGALFSAVLWLLDHHASAQAANMAVTYCWLWGME